jgi:hypothetical protein
LTHIGLGGGLGLAFTQIGLGGGLGLAFTHIGLGGGRGLMVMKEEPGLTGGNQGGPGHHGPMQIPRGIRIIINIFANVCIHLYTRRCVRKMKFNMHEDICTCVYMYYITIIMDAYRYINRWEDAPIIVIS